jgi:hypothetical protein
MSCTPYRPSTPPCQEQHIYQLDFIQSEEEVIALGKKETSIERAPTVEHLRGRDIHLNKKDGFSVKTLASRFQGNNKYGNHQRSQPSASKIPTDFFNEHKYSGEDFQVKEEKEKLGHHTFEPNCDEVVSKLMDHSWQDANKGKAGRKNPTQSPHKKHCQEEIANTKEEIVNDCTQLHRVDHFWKNKLRSQKQRRARSRIRCVSSVESSSDWNVNEDKPIDLDEHNTDKGDRHTVAPVERPETQFLKELGNFQQPQMENSEVSSRRISSSHRTRSWTQFLNSKENDIQNGNALKYPIREPSALAFREFNQVATKRFSYTSKKESSNTGDKIIPFQKDETLNNEMKKCHRKSNPNRRLKKESEPTCRAILEIGNQMSSHVNHLSEIQVLDNAVICQQDSISLELAHPTKSLFRSTDGVGNGKKEEILQTYSSSKAAVEKAGASPDIFQGSEIERTEPTFNFWKNHPRVGRCSPKLQNLTSENPESNYSKGRVEGGDKNKATKIPDLKKSLNLHGVKTTQSVQICNHHSRGIRRSLPVPSAKTYFHTLSQVQSDANLSILKSTSQKIHTHVDTKENKNMKTFEQREVLCNEEDMDPKMLDVRNSTSMETPSSKDAFRERILKFDMGSSILPHEEKTGEEQNESNIRMKGRLNANIDSKNQIINGKHDHTNSMHAIERLTQLLEDPMQPDDGTTDSNALDSLEGFIYSQNKEFSQLTSQGIVAENQELPLRITMVDGHACDHSRTNSDKLINTHRNEVPLDQTTKVLHPSPIRADVHSDVEPSKTRMKRLPKYNRFVKKSVSSALVSPEISKPTRYHLHLSTEAIHNFHMAPSSTDTTATETTLDEISGILPLSSPQRHKRLPNTPTETITEERVDVRESSPVEISMVSIKEVKRKLWGPDEKLRCQKDDFDVRVDESTVNSIFKTRFHRAAEVSQKNKAIEDSSHSDHSSKNKVCDDTMSPSLSFNQNINRSSKVFNEQLTGKNTDMSNIQGSYTVHSARFNTSRFSSKPRHVPVIQSITHEPEENSTIYKAQHVKKSRLISNGESRSVSTLVTKINLVKREDESTALEVIDSILASECKDSGVKEELRPKTSKDVNDVTKLVSKINAVRRDDASAALAVIDSIIESECKVLGIARPVENHKIWNQPKLIERRLDDEYSSCRNERDPEDIELTSEDEDDSDSDDSTVSSITNPTYQSGFGDIRIKSRKKPLCDLVARDFSPPRESFGSSAFLSKNEAIAEEAAVLSSFAEGNKLESDGQHIQNRKTRHQWTALESPPLLYRKSNQPNTAEKISHTHSSPLRSSKYTCLMRVKHNPIPAEESTFERNRSSKNTLPINSFSRGGEGTDNHDVLKRIQSCANDDGNDENSSRNIFIEESSEAKEVISPSRRTMTLTGQHGNNTDNGSLELDGKSVQHFRRQNAKRTRRRLFYPGKVSKENGNTDNTGHLDGIQWKEISCGNPTRGLGDMEISQKELTYHVADAFNELDISFSSPDQREAFDGYAYEVVDLNHKNTILAQKFSSVEQAYENIS